MGCHRFHPFAMYFVDCAARQPKFIYKHIYMINNTEEN